MGARPERLAEDRDLYLGIANEIWSGHGYSTPESSPPRATAFRPPLYPLMLALTGGSRVGVAVLHLLLAGGMVVATGLAAQRLAGPKRACDWTARLIAGGIVAIDPLLLLYSGQPMTETLCSCLTAVLLWWVAVSSQRRSGSLAPGEARSGSQGQCGGEGAGKLGNVIVEGILWGLCLLARPTYAVAFGLWFMGRVLSEGGLSRLRGGLLVGGVALAVLSPWMVRNSVVLGRPIMTTTHGGYTLWLANNPVYYCEVVEGHDSAWRGESLDRWQQATDAEMDRLHLTGEVARDQWLSQHAREFIRANPQRFARACLYRGLAFWSIWPGRSAGIGVPFPVLLLIAGGYAALWIAGVVATFRVIRSGEWRGLLPAFCLIVGFFSVHLVYWTDARMRAPIMPAVAVLVAVGFSGQNRDVTEKPTDSKAG